MNSLVTKVVLVTMFTYTHRRIFIDEKNTRALSLRLGLNMTFYQRLSGLHTMPAGIYSQMVSCIKFTYHVKISVHSLISQSSFLRDTIIVFHFFCILRTDFYAFTFEMLSYLESNFRCRLATYCPINLKINLEMNLSLYLLPICFLTRCRGNSYIEQQHIKMPSSTGVVCLNQLNARSPILFI